MALAFTVSEPVVAIELMFTAKVVVPAEITKSLKEVKIALGKVLVAVNSRVPVPGVHTAVAPLPEESREVAFIKPPLLILISLFTPPLVALFKYKAPQIKVASELKVTTPTLVLFDGPPTSTLPVTVNLGLVPEKAR